MGAGLIGALAAISGAMLTGLDFRSKQLEKHPVPPKGGHSNRGHLKPKDKQRGVSGQYANLARLICDRSSNIRKINRWARAGSLTPPEPEPWRALKHAERRREVERKAMIEAAAAFRGA